MFVATARKPAGYAIIVDPEGPTIERDTLQCSHCGKHWFVIPGSGRRRGFCLKCQGVTCGAHACETKCRPFEARVYGER